jgi:Zn-dependent M28 family amino/carboxypeptidase
VGAHLDHIPPINGQICNGADDNASGSAGVLEIAEAVARSPFQRSVLFILYTAEETGLYGSRHFVRFCPVPITDILVNINLDMIGRTDRVQAETRSHYALYSEQIDPEIINRIKAVNTDPVMWPLVYKELRTFPGGSDHVSFMERNIPAVFFFSGHHADLHRPTDDADKIEYDKMQKISQLIYRLVEDYANCKTN